MGAIQMLKEAVTGNKNGVVVTSSQKSSGSVPAVKFKDMVDLYLKDPTARAAIDFVSEQAVGIGFYTTAEDEDAKSLIDDFCARVDLDSLLKIGAQETIAFGNSFWEKIPSPKIESLIILPIISIEKIFREYDGTEIKIKQSGDYGGKELDAKKIIHFIYNPINRDAFGSGLLRTLLEGYYIDASYTRDPIAKMKAKMQDAMIRQFEKFSSPNELWVLEGLRDDKTKTLGEKITSMPKSGARWVTNSKGEIKMAALPRVTEFDSYVENIMNELYLGLQTPLPKLFTTPGFTEASAKAALEMHSQRVRGIQRYFKRMIETQIFAPVLESNGFKQAEAKVRLNWGMPEQPTITFADLINAAMSGLIRSDEFRTMAVKMGWELSEPEKETKPSTPEGPSQAGGAD